MWFTKVSLNNPVFAAMVMLAFVVLGLFSLQRLQVDQFPNVDFPVVVITTEYPGAAPTIVESEVTKKVEEAVNSVAGINALYSRSYENLSVVIVEFQLHIEGRKAAEDVREKIGQVRPLLREEVKEPRVLRFDPASRAIWSVAVLPQASEGRAAPSPIELTNWADQVLKKRLENVRGVGAVNLVGGAKREIHIQLRPAALEALGVTPEQVMAAVRGDNQDQPLGALRTPAQELTVQLQGRVERPEDFGRLIVARRGGAPIHLAQVADVRDGAQEQESLALHNGERTLLLNVQKAQDENTIGVVDGLYRAVAEIRAELPPGVRLEPVIDQSRPIRVAVQNVRQTLIEGAVLTVLIVFLFLNSWRSTVITGLTLPISIIGTFFFMQVLGFTVNMITLMALSLCVGLLIDDAIVVRENIVRHAQMGKRSYDAAMDGTQEIGLAVLATTLSIVAVFLPIGFMQGIIGKFFHEFGLTIVAAVLISMFVSFTLDPMLSSVWHDPSIHAHGQRSGPPVTLYERTIGRVTAWFDHASDRLADGYQRLLGWSLAHKPLTLLIAAAIFGLSVAMVRLLGTEFVPKADFSETNVAFYTPQGSSLEATEAKARQVDALLRSYPEVRYTVATLNAGNAQGKTNASLYIRLVDRHERTRNADDLAADFRQRLRAVPGITVTQAGLLEPVGGQKQIEFSLQGPDQAELERLARPLMERLRDIPGLVDLDSSSKPDKPTVEVTVKRAAASELGLSSAQIAAPLRTLIAGTTVGNWRAPDDQTYDVVVRLAADARSVPQDLERLPLTAGLNADGTPRIVRLNQVATLNEASGTNQINRRAMLREIQITANTHGRATGEVSGDIRAALAQMPFPPGYSYSFGGATKNMEESFTYALQALAMAIIFIYMILASQFKSFVQPLALMTSLPLTLIGVVLALLMFGSAMSMFSIIGIVMLMGLVTKNAILLVDFAIRAREGRVSEGGVTEPLPREQALLAAARVRLRPILMTTLAMVFGMVPLAFAVSEGSEQRAPMGQAVIGGVITSSLLTLVVVPVVYCYLDDLAGWLKRRLHRAPPDASAG
ncbi:MAG TPA: efflux RND transporter permease subunit [Ottowia sp.]|uniref:efflux RND transporter permease subunit n=1 Tax=Ottowia sp. TaxID=1898956 RepID=UPI002C2C8987|nr:efflux RND transporter permease subunit [Ottowia sp.]HNR82389.1 efflux RND transporter permease subunit [Ottowia sp.]HNT83512.1 efflux RND transporter permease subunit [Ottowia sp.]HQO52644.1 efflux RND transporter permease subunit [Ottowia sp.]